MSILSVPGSLPLRSVMWLAWLGARGEDWGYLSQLPAPFPPACEITCTQCVAAVPATAWEGDMLWLPSMPGRAKAGKEEHTPPSHWSMKCISFWVVFEHTVPSVPLSGFSSRWPYPAVRRFLFAHADEQCWRQMCLFSDPTLAGLMSSVAGGTEGLRLSAGAMGVHQHAAAHCPTGCHLLRSHMCTITTQKTLFTHTSKRVTTQQTRRLLICCSPYRKHSQGLVPVHGWPQCRSAKGLLETLPHQSTDTGCLIPRTVGTFNSCLFSLSSA